MKKSILTWSLSFLLIHFCNASAKEGELYKLLLRGYNPLVRPVKDPSSALTVQMKVFLQQIIDVNEKDQTVQINAWLQYKWNDYRLRWLPDEFDNVTSVRFSSGEESVTIWRPDVLLYNSADEKFDSTYKSHMVVYNSGEVNWIPPGIFTITCKIDITWFPFDTQTCFLKFGSWSYHGEALDLQVDMEGGEDAAFDLSTYVSNGEWILESVAAEREEKFYACCPEPYPTIRFFLRLKRRTLFFAFNLIVPSLLISLMTLMCFCLPAHDMAEKIGYQTTILLSVCFFLTILSEMTPNTSEALPLIGIFFSTVTLIISASTAFTITVLSLRYRQPFNHRMTPTLRYFFLDFIPWLLLMTRPGHKFHRFKGESVDKKFASDCVQCLNRDGVEAISIDCMDDEDPAKEPLLKHVCSVPIEQLSLNRKVGDGLFAARRSGSLKQNRIIQFEKYVKKCVDSNEKESTDRDFANFAIEAVNYYAAIHALLKIVREDTDKKKELQDIQEDWKYAAMALDRLCLVVFTAFLTITTTAIFYMAPYLNA